MAKLNGVVLMAEVIEYNGVKYGKVEGAVQVGDIVRETSNSYVDVTSGEFYEVVSGSYPHFIDDGGDVRGIDGGSYKVRRDHLVVFRKASESQTQQYREVKRPAEVGERIRIVNAKMACGRYGNDDEFIVKAACRNQSGTLAHVKVESLAIAILDEEYVVLEPIAEQSDDIIVVDGVKYRKVDRKPKVGDFVYMIQPMTDLTKGKIYEVYSLYSDGDGRFRDNVGDTRCFSRNSTTRQLVERIATAEVLERQVSELQTKLHEAEAELAAKKAEEEAAKRLKVGEYAKVIGGSNYHVEIGDIVIIRSVYFDGDYEINSLDGRELGGFKLAKNLVRATDEEVAEARRKLELSKEIAKWAAIGRKVGEFKKGDVVSYIGGTGGNALNNHKNILTTIVEDEGPCGTVTNAARYRLGKPGFVLSTNGTWARGSDLKLIAPVESVVNLAAAN